MSQGTLGPDVAAVPRAGILGGAFDPPHRMHRALAEAALSQLGLDRLHVMPTGHAWHKARSLSPAAHRVAMAQLAFAGLPRVVVDEQETRRDGPSYTVDTLRALQAQHPGHAWFVIIGQDQAAHFTGWHRWQEILQLATICIAERQDQATPAPDFDWQLDAPGRWVRLLIEPQALSATDIRQRAASGQRLDGLVAEPVARYIEAHHLYSTA